MDVCYKKLLKLLIDKGMKKADLRKATGISPNTMTKLSNNEFVSMDVLVKICITLNCDFGDIVEVVSSTDNSTVKIVK
ncbi:hypothetical protein SDC9_37704 [bioreactor metagenome]|uniref:HTH cro/C1-type domain-containing protein n=1 Tax=bioreactor metagenome TaxID=1076179 RepID=A0A644VJW6_9ZZZZ|nr:helix-turn-helix transcriptional regulator [Acidaminococcaceae bacterium]